jgi:hypothetical protein
MDAVLPLIGVVLGAVLAGGLDWWKTRRQIAGEIRGAVRVVVSEIGYAIQLAATMREEPLEASRLSPIELATVGEHVRILGRIAPYETWVKARAADRLLHRLQAGMASPGPDVEQLAERLEDLRADLAPLIDG